jgi:hypothetical protein
MAGFSVASSLAPLIERDSQTKKSLNLTLFISATLLSANFCSSVGLPPSTAIGNIETFFALAALWTSPQATPQRRVSLGAPSDITNSHGRW